jgi:drug/metabolite transporter (DMT)-like permease
VRTQPSRLMIIAAFAAIYTIWGSSYIGIHYAIQTIPPFLMTGVRFLPAGLLLFVIARLRGTPMPTRTQWRSMIIAGFFLFLLNNAAIVWAEGHGVSTGVAAILIATVPMWIVFLNWLKPMSGASSGFPGGVVLAGLALGFVGIIVLINPGDVSFNLVGMLVVLFGAFAWAYGSLYAKHAPAPESGTMGIGMQLISGGVMQLFFSVVTGELATFNPAQVSLQSVLATVYLSIVSSIIAYRAFVWLMKVYDPAKVATYAYVNPVVAVFLGWLLLGEPITPRTIGAAAVIIAAVVIINRYGGKRRTAQMPAAEGLPAEVEVAEARL